MRVRKKAMVTGGAGYIGSHVTWALLEAGWDVVVIDDLSTGRRESVAAAAAFILGDVGEPVTINAALAEHRPDAVLHLAGSAIIPESVIDPLKYYRNNTAASRTLIEATVNAGIDAFLFSSTAAIYGVPPRMPIDEDMPTQPITPYGTSKLCTEFILRDVAAATSMRYVSLRYFNVAGADPKGRTGQSTPISTHLIKIACETIVGKRSFFNICGDDYPTPDGTCIRDYLHVSDLADLHVTAIEYLVAGGASEAFNCGYGHGYSVAEVANVIRQVAGGHIDARIAPRRPGDPPQLVADARKIRRQFGWQPKYDDLRFIVETALAWERWLQARAA
ncbi:UDP-glucose 4-epimerase GalE [Defluviicoccus vanus]|uniref:UDP-glucose 4-epimerase n=1 Tax=Defluviicoccus vanus TaxID=111831 RepID=A0A7H1N3Z7_9PROT|nr:UDP-glucose 4-epimerase GalE [Defluviicoccus vanus]QNT70433.1 UDP-glucose 4-epimerase GalE [Defluviicoccus vanus]